MSRMVDPSIPLLTERVELTQTAARKLAGPLADISTELPDFPQTLAGLQAHQGTELDKVALDALELRVREQVLRTLAPRVEALIDSRLHNKLNELVDHVLIGLSAQIKDSIRETLRDAVTRTVSDELLKALVDHSSKVSVNPNPLR